MGVKEALASCQKRAINVKAALGCLMAST